MADLETPEPSDPDQRIKRQSKSKRYDRLDLVAQHPSQSIDESVIENHWQEKMAGLPAAQSSHIVLGESLGAETHLSNDKKGVYTEFSIRVAEIIKGDNPALIPGRIVAVDRPGGFVRYPGGHKILYRIFGMNMPRANKQYLLFLDNPEHGLNYHLLTGYEMTPGGVLPLDVGLNFDAYKGMDATSFLQAVRNAVEGSSQASPH
jgi:hypothetical protein